MPTLEARRFQPTDPRDNRLEQIVTTLVLLWTFLALCFPMLDTDFWWHLRTGELIIQRGELPSVDWFTFRDSDRPWIDLHWGFQLLITGLYHLGGSPLIVLAKALVLTATVGLAWSATGRTIPVWLKGLLWFPAIVAITGRGYERPEVLSQLFLATWLWIVFRLAQRPHLIWCLPFVQIVWINCHSLFILGLVVGASYVIDRLGREAAQGRWGLEPASNEPPLRTVAWAGLAAVVAALCNPYFEQGALFPLELYRKFSVEQDFYSVRIGEFTRPVDFALKFGPVAFTNFYFLAELTIWLLATASFLWLGSYGRWSILRLLLYAGFSHLAWEATRNTNIFAIVSAVIMCANCDDAIRMRATSPGRPARRSQLVAVMCFYCVLIISVLTGGWNTLGERNKPFGFGELPAWFAHDACRFAGQTGFPHHAFVAHIGQAGVYIYHNGPDRRVFMDGRLEVCSRKTFELFDEIRHLMATGDRRWERLLPRDDQGRMPAIILDARASRHEINGLYQTPGWRLVYADRVATVFLEESLANKLSLPPASLEPLLNVKQY